MIRYKPGSDPDETMPSFELTPLDQRIKELNHQEPRLSNTAIAKILNAEGIKLNRRTVDRHLMEMRQDPNNKIRQNFKSFYTKPKKDLKWYNIMLRVPKEAENYTKMFGFKPTSRTMGYHFVDLEERDGTKILKPNEIGRFVEVATDARLGWTDANGELWFPKLDIDIFADDSRRSLGSYDNSLPQSAIPATRAKLPDVFIRDAIKDLKQSIIDYDGIEYRGTWGKAGGYWYGQDAYVEIWQEKNDLLDGFYTLTKDRHIEVKANKGFSSLVWLYKCCESLKEVMELGYEPKDIHIGYCGDWDPSGWEQFCYIRRRLNQLGIFGIDLQWVAVTKEQLRKYKLPIMSIDPEEGKNPNPSRKEFVRLHGTDATHLNAFFTPKRIKRFKNDILLPWIDQFYDKDIYDQMIEEYDVPPPQSDVGYSGERLRHIHQDMVQQVTNAFQPGWTLDVPDGLYDNEDGDGEEA